MIGIADYVVVSGAGYCRCCCSSSSGRVAGVVVGTGIGYYGWKVEHGIRLMLSLKTKWLLSTSSYLSSSTRKEWIGSGRGNNWCTISRGSSSKHESSPPLPLDVVPVLLLALVLNPRAKSSSEWQCPPRPGSHRRLRRGGKGSALQSAAKGSPAAGRAMHPTIKPTI